MNSVINPWIFYLMDVSAGIEVASMVALIVCGAVCALGTLGIGEYQKGYFQTFKVFIIISIVAGVLAVIIPSQETLMKMLITSCITPDNIEFGVETVKSIVEYIVETVNSMGPGGV